MACCSVLDIGDFNNHYKEDSAHKENPGLKWAPKTQTSNNLFLLGYNYTAPPSPYDEGIIDRYCRYMNLNLLDGNIKSIESSGRIEPVAWVKANADESDYDTACAITPEYYYCIYYVPFYSKKDRRWEHRKRRIYAIKRSAWDRPEGPPLQLGGVSDKNIVDLKYELPDIPSVIHP